LVPLHGIDGTHEIFAAKTVEIEEITTITDDMTSRQIKTWE
jgi:hypothetical protein